MSGVERVAAADAASVGKRHLGDRGTKLLAAGMYVSKEGEAQNFADAAPVWEGQTIHVPATVFQEDDPTGYYAGNVRSRRPLPHANAH